MFDATAEAGDVLADDALRRTCDDLRHATLILECGELRLCGLRNVPCCVFHVPCTISCATLCLLTFTAQ
jgi:hypothetical protein